MMKPEELDMMLTKMEAVITACEERGYAKNGKMQRKAIDAIRKEGAAAFKHVDPKYVKQMREELDLIGVPYVEIPGDNGTSFVVATSGESSLLTAQAEVMFNKLEFVRFCTVENILKSAADMGYKDVLRLSFANPLACKVALQELYKSKIPSAVVRKDSTFTLFIHPEYLYRNGDMDFSDFRLKMAMYEAEAAAVFGGSKSQFLVTKLKQVQYDDATLVKFAESVKERKPVVYGDAFAKSPCYLESKSSDIVVNEKVDGEWVGHPLSIDGSATATEVKKICMSYLSVIRNAAVIPRKLWNAKFRDGDPDKTDEDVSSVMKERPKYSKEVKPYYKLQSTKLQAVIDAVTNEANKRTEGKVGVVSLLDPEAVKNAYDMKAEEIAELLEEGMLPEFDDFLKDEEEELSEKQKMQWLMDLMNSYEGTKDKPIISYTHGVISHETAREEVAKSVTREVEKEKREEKE